ncbi:MAG: S8 family serine peptidase [Proteobacteria bacterium]|nr:S8 family serine peptidase [Pseudomonadota bacterium]
MEEKLKQHGFASDPETGDLLEQREGGARLPRKLLERLGADLKGEQFDEDGQTRRLDVGMLGALIGSARRLQEIDRLDPAVVGRRLNAAGLARLADKRLVDGEAATPLGLLAYHALERAMGGDPEALTIEGLNGRIGQYDSALAVRGLDEALRRPRSLEANLDAAERNFRKRADRGSLAVRLEPRVPASIDGLLAARGFAFDRAAGVLAPEDKPGAGFSVLDLRRMGLLPFEDERGGKFIAFGQAHPLDELNDAALSKLVDNARALLDWKGVDPALAARKLQEWGLAGVGGRRFVDGAMATPLGLLMYREVEKLHGTAVRDAARGLEGRLGRDGTLRTLELFESALSSPRIFAAEVEAGREHLKLGPGDAPLRLEPTPAFADVYAARRPEFEERLKAAETEAEREDLRQALWALDEMKSAAVPRYRGIVGVPLPQVLKERPSADLERLSGAMASLVAKLGAEFETQARSVLAASPFHDLAELGVHKLWVHTRGEGMRIAVVDGFGRGDRHGESVEQAIRLIAPKAVIDRIDVFGGQSFTGLQNLLDGIRRAAEARYDLVNVSMNLIDLSRASPDEERFIAQSAHRTVFVASAGNGGTNADPARRRVQWPSTASGVISAGAWEPATGRVNSYTSIAPHTQNAERVSYLPPVHLVDGRDPSINGRFGTSFAAGRLTGAAALILAHRRSFEGDAPLRHASSELATALLSGRPRVFAEPYGSGVVVDAWEAARVLGARERTAWRRCADGMSCRAMSPVPR